MLDNSIVFNAKGTDFQQVVLDKSTTVPVLVDFWAAWCGPCQSLMPVLAKLADEYAGKFLLAKVDTDAEQELAMQFGVRSLPTVKLFIDGKVAGEFMGAQPKSSVRAFLDQYIPNETAQLAQAAMTLYEQGEKQEALVNLKQCLEKEPDNDLIKLNLANLYLREGDIEEARTAFESVSANAKLEIDYKTAIGKLKLAEAAADAPDISDLEQRIENNPDDSQARYALSAKLTLEQRYEDAMDQLLEIVKRDRKFNDDAGRKGLVDIFNMLGNKDERVTRYRPLLARAIN